ncbi:MAG: hypothetical protein WBW94_16220 [Anaerolineales bacterium]
MQLSIAEKTIEDILYTDKAILADLLGCNPVNLSIIARQKILNSGKLDLLCLYESELWLLELKAVPFYNLIIDQINGYHADLMQLQKQQKLIAGTIKKIILVTNANQTDIQVCAVENIDVKIYHPENVLEKFFENFRERSAFIKIQSADFGVVRLGLLVSTLNLLGKGKNITEIAQAQGKSQKTIRNRFSVSEQLGLMQKAKEHFFLTELGNSFTELTSELNDNNLTEKQVDLLSKFMVESPFYSSFTYTILSFIETVFILSKSSYPVKFNDARDFFVKSVGKESTWKTKRSRETATYIFSNYTCDLQFLTKINNSFYLTPKGIQAILLLQLNRSIKLIEQGD